jgi:hypothetical protein
MLYSYKNSYPTNIPFRIRLSDGRTRTDPSTFTPEEILDAGYIEVSDPPQITEYQVLTWTGTQWFVRDMNSDEISEVERIKKEKIINLIVSQVQNKLDTFSQTRNYDNIVSLCTYATSPVQKFATEAQYGVQCRSLTWEKLYEILDEAERGLRPIPTDLSDIDSELPILEWPE